MADRFIRAESAVGPAMGATGCGLASCAAPGAGAGINWSRAGRHFALARLGASALRSDALRRNCCGRWLRIAALHYEAQRAGANLGFFVNFNFVGHFDSFLGCVAGAATASGGLRL